MVKCTPRLLFIFFTGDFLRASTEKKILDNFKRLMAENVLQSVT